MSRKDLANAIRALSMDAVQKPIPGTPARRWGWRISLKCYGTIFLNITPPIRPGMTVIVLSFPTVTPPCCSIVCCI